MTEHDHEIRPSDGSHLEREQVEKIERYVAKVLRRLDLNYWRVYVAKDLPPDDAFAMICPADGRRCAALYVHEDWNKRTPYEQQLTLVHECLHLAHHDQEFTVRRWVDDSPLSVTDSAEEMFRRFKVDTERMVDSLANALTPLMPRWK